MGRPWPTDPEGAAPQAAEHDRRQKRHDQDHADGQSVIAEDAADPQRGGHDQRKIDHVADDRQRPAAEEAMARGGRGRSPGERVDREADQDQPERATQTTLL